MAYLFIIITTVLLILVLSKCFLVRRENKYTYPPGPKGLPFLGNVLQFKDVAQHLKHHELSRIYGDAHTISMFGQTIVVLSSMDAVKECRLEHSEDFNHRPVWLEGLVKIAPGIVFKGADTYKENRRFAMRHLKDHGMGRAELEPKIHGEADYVLSVLENAKERTLDPHDLMETYTLNVISQMCFTMSWPHGSKESKRIKQNMKSINESQEAISALDFLPFLNYVPSLKKIYQDYLENIECLQTIGRNAVTDRQRSVQITKGEETDLSYESVDLVDDFLIASKHKPSPEEIRNFMEIAQDMFQAGMHTSATTLTFAIIRLIHNPQIQEELFKEIEENLGDKTEITMGDIKTMPMMDAFIQEVLRMYPIAPLIFHATLRDSKLRHFFIPQNTTILINAYGINHDENQFTNPEVFDPKRWLQEDGTFKGHERDRIFTFGAGHRSCIGKALARLEIFLLLVKLLQKYKLVVPDESNLPSTEIIMHRVLVCNDEFQLKAIPRQ